LRRLRRSGARLRKRKSEPEIAGVLLKCDAQVSTCL
jgi:hypothetical protein